MYRRLGTAKDRYTSVFNQRSSPNFLKHSVGNCILPQATYKSSISGPEKLDCGLMSEDPKLSRISNPTFKLQFTVDSDVALV